MRTLVLNFFFQPIACIPWEKAISLWYLEKAEILEEYKENVHSPSITLKVPSVIKLLRKPPVKKVNRMLAFSRERVYIRDAGVCQFCGEKIPKNKSTLDHLLPKSKGGKTNFKNVVIACSPCNTKKANNTPEQAGMKLLKEPKFSMNFSEYFRFKLKTDCTLPKEWRIYIK